MKKYKEYPVEELTSEVHEALLDYISEKPAMRVILGGKQKAGMHAVLSDYDELDMIRLSREGLKKDALFSLASYLGISMEQMATLLQTSHRNMLRKDASDVLDSYKTEKAIELAAFAKRGIEVIGTQSGFKEWLQLPLMALGNKKPLDFLDTTFGIQLVLKILGRLEQGVFS